jgi:hypothetical protein
MFDDWYSGGLMRHEWIFEVLRDMKAYALANGLPALALKAEEALRVARAEVSGASKPVDAAVEPEGGGFPPMGRPH